MRTVLRRYVWVVDLIGMLAGAALAGHLAATQVLARLLPGVPPPAPCVPAPIAPAVVEHYELPRAVVDSVVGGVSAGPHSIHIAPEVRRGKTVGLRLLDDPRGQLAAIGLAGGDVLLKANGVPLTKPAAMLAAYWLIKEANEARLVIDRSGRRLRVTYRCAFPPPLPR
jgi:hypothetical protein